MNYTNILGTEEKQMITALNAPLFAAIDIVNWILFTFTPFMFILIQTLPFAHKFQLLGKSEISMSTFMYRKCCYVSLQRTRCGDYLVFIK